MAVFYSAKNAKIRIGAGAVTFASKKWVGDDKVDELDTSNFETAGFTDRIAGLADIVLTIDMDIDGANPWDGAVNLRKGTILTNVRAYLNDLTGPYFSLPVAIVLSGPVTHDVKQTGQMQVVIKNKGTWSYPTGTIAA